MQMAERGTWDNSGEKAGWGTSGGAKKLRTPTFLFPIIDKVRPFPRSQPAPDSIITTLQLCSCYSLVWLLDQVSVRAQERGGRRR